MDRFQKFKEIRIIKIRLFIAFSLCIVITLSGIGLVDYEINFLLTSENNVKVFRLNNDFQSGIFTIYLVGKRIDLNTFYVIRDYIKFIETINSYREHLFKWE